MPSPAPCTAAAADAGASPDANACACNDQVLAPTEESNELLRSGRVDEAAEKYESALSLAAEASDRLSGILLQNVGAAALQLGHHRTATVNASILAACVVSYLILSCLCIF